MHEFFFRKFTKSRAGTLRGNHAVISCRPEVQYGLFLVYISARLLVFAAGIALMYVRPIAVLNVKQTMFILLLFASLPDCGQNQTAVSEKQYSLSDF
jgi:hypothetical protein